MPESRPERLDDAKSLFTSLVEPFTAEALFDCLPDVVYFVKNVRGQYIVVNQTLVNRCGADNKEQLIGRTPSEVFPKSLGAGYLEQDLALIRSGEPLVGELELHLYNSGDAGWCLTTKLPLWGEDHICVGLVGMSKDLQPPTEHGREFQQLAEAVRYAKRHLEDPLCVDDLASVADLSPFQLDQRMKKVFHLTTGQWIVKLRMELATKLLRGGDDPIVQIAFSCGYSDQSAFTRQFRKTTGMSPGKYRSLMKAKS